MEHLGTIVPFSYETYQAQFHFGMEFYLVTRLSSIRNGMQNFTLILHGTGTYSTVPNNRHMSLIQACFLAVWLKTEAFKNSEFPKTQKKFTKTQQKFYKNSDFRKIMSNFKLRHCNKKTALNICLITAHLLHITINFALS